MKIPMLFNHNSLGNEVVKLTQEMIRFPSISGEETDLAEFLAGVMKQKGLLVEKIPTKGGRFNVVGKLQGTEGRPVLVMNGHMDVVPAGDLEKWTHDPFSGEIVDGRIYGR
jgi:succinyl-diaminopimelate desuccinylase